MTIEDDFLKLKEKSDDLLEVVVKTFKLDVLCDKFEKLLKAFKFDVLCDKIEKLLKVWRDR